MAEVTEHDGGRIGCNHSGGICSETPDGTWPPTDETTGDVMSENRDSAGAAPPPHGG